jgi:hypothetical protein
MIDPLEYNKTQQAENIRLINGRWYTFHVCPSGKDPLDYAVHISPKRVRHEPKFVSPTAEDYMRVTWGSDNPNPPWIEHD